MLIVPRLNDSGRVVMHRRSMAKDVSPGMWDFCGGHIRYDESVVDVRSLGEHVENEARREGAEELLGGRTWDEIPGQWRRLTGVGELLLDSEVNLEFATAFVVTVASVSDIVIADDVIGNRVERAREIVVAAYEELRTGYERGTLMCAEGAVSIFKRFERVFDVDSRQ